MQLNCVLISLCSRLVAFVKLTQARYNWKEGTRLRDCLHQIGLWVCLMGESPAHCGPYRPWAISPEPGSKGASEPCSTILSVSVLASLNGGLSLGSERWCDKINSFLHKLRLASILSHQQKENNAEGSSYHHMSELRKVSIERQPGSVIVHS